LSGLEASCGTASWILRLKTLTEPGRLSLAARPQRDRFHSRSRRHRTADGV